MTMEVPRPKSVGRRTILNSFSFKLITAVILVLLLAALVVAVAREAIVASNVSNTASFHELQGIQGADTTQNVAQQKKAKAAGKPEVVKELEDIRVKKVAHFQLIHAAQRTQNEYYSANEKGNNAAGLRSELERLIPEARGALAELKKLTDREAALLKRAGGDNNAVFVSQSFYTAMEAIVNTLQLDELTPAQIEAREKFVQRGGNSAIATAHVMARNFDADAMESEEKLTLEQEVVVPGEKSVKGLGDVLGQLPKIIWASIQGASEGLSMVNRAMSSYRGSGGMAQMMHDMSYNQGMFSRKNMDAHQQRMDAIGSGVHQFLNTYSPFIRTVGQSIGRQVDTDAMGYGDNVIIRFADSKGRMYIVKEDENMRIIVDKFLTRWDDGEHEVRTMVIFEYNDAGVESAAAEFEQLAPGFGNYVRDSRIIYVYRGYRTAGWRSFLYEINFQDSEGRQKYHYSTARAPDGIRLRRGSLDSMIIETIGVMNPPKDDSAFKRRFGARTRPRAQAQDRPELREDDNKEELEGPSSSSPEQGEPAKPVSAKPDKPEKPAKPAQASKPSKPALARKGAIELPPEGVEAFDAMDLDGGAKAAILQEHNSGVENYNAGKFGVALRQFGRAAGMSEKNYLDAYWAALAAHKTRNNSTVKKWLDYCLSAKADYVPALNMKRALGLK